ncbi:unnamed protein product [Durusdinium trenchii]|uniref:RING-type domain-containing protein n=1 Tax=Durusdinium trenchii TaxID=1381693 RepID=A0ABP0LLZ4_9DINO
MASRAGSSQIPDQAPPLNRSSSSDSSFGEFLDPPGRYRSGRHGSVPRHPRAKLLVAILSAMEIATVVPTLWLEQQIGGGPEHMVLRISLMFLRLYPILRVLVLCLYFSGPSRCFGLLPFSLQWSCREWCLWFLRAGSCGSRFPEIRWGMAVTLDMWFMLTSPLAAAVRGLRLQGQELSAAVMFWVLFANCMICALDAVALIMSLVYSKHLVAEVHPEVTFHRPRSIKWGIGEEGNNSTCAICLSEFTEGEAAQLLPCGHVFHTDCVTSWLQVSRSCPMRCPDLILPVPPDELDGNNHGRSDLHQTSMQPPELFVLPGEAQSESR